MDAEYADPQLVRLAQSVRRCPCRFDCGTERDQHSAGVVHAVTGHGRVAPAGLCSEQVEGGRQRLVDICIEERAAPERSQGETVRLEERTAEDGFIRILPKRHTAARVTKQQLLGRGGGIDDFRCRSEQRARLRG